MIQQRRGDEIIDQVESLGRHFPVCVAGITAAGIGTAADEAGGLQVLVVQDQPGTGYDDEGVQHIYF